MQCGNSLKVIRLKRKRLENKREIGSLFGVIILSASSLQKSCLFLCIDCLRGDMLYTGGRKIPFLKKIARNSVFYSNMYSTATSTTPSVASFFTGLYPPKNGIKSLKDVLSPHVPTLAEKFRNAGYVTHALTSGPLIKETGLKRGFQYFRSREGNQTIFTDWYSVLLSYIDELIEREEKFFLFLHIWALHKPLNYSQKYQHKEYGPTSYERTLSALDRKLERIVEKFPKETCIAICSDHGESIIGRDIPGYQKFRTLINYLKVDLKLDFRNFLSILDSAYLYLNDRLKDHLTIEYHGDHIYDFLTNVPFILRDKRLENRVIDKQVRHVDIFPTILDLFDIPFSPRKIDGQSMLPLNQIEDRPSYMRACGGTLRGQSNWIEGLRTPKWKLATYPYKDWTPELYDLIEDGFELRNRAKKEKEITQQLKRKLRRILESGKSFVNREKIKERIKEIRKQLQK